MSTQPSVVLLRTERLVMRPFTPDDVDPIFAIISEPNIMQYFPNPTDTSRARAERIVLHQIEGMRARGYSFLALELADSGALIGWCGLNYIADKSETEVGYLLAHAHWGQGLATEAASRSVEWGFVDHRLPQIVGLTHPNNLASQNVLRKAGLHLTGPAHYFGMDCLRFAATR